MGSFVSSPGACFTQAGWVRGLVGGATGHAAGVGMVVNVKTAVATLEPEPARQALLARLAWAMRRAMSLSR
jgi:hypothetical protein